MTGDLQDDLTPKRYDPGRRRKTTGVNDNPLCVKENSRSHRGRHGTPSGEEGGS